jgi:3-isopropylmalate dehydrogenase
MRKHILVLPGDGIGPEIINATIKILKVIEYKYKHEFILNEALIGSSSIKNYGVPITQNTLNQCKQSDAILFGAIGDKQYDDHPDITIKPEQGLLTLRKKLNLYTNIRPIKYYNVKYPQSPIKKKIIKNVDFLIYRELTGGIYFGDKGFNKSTNSAFDTCYYSSIEIERIAKKAFEAAMKRKNKVTLIDKSNVLETSKLWRKTITDMKNKLYNNIKLEYLFIDNATMQILINPRKFDIILTENMFGDIISDEASVVTGGSIGLLPSASIGDQYAMFEPVHGSYPQAKNKNIANPIGAILSAGMMLEYFKMYKESKNIEDAVKYTLQNNIATIDINYKNPATTQQVRDAIIKYIIEN